MSTTVHFKISSELKNVIGRDLITDDFVAIFELVKNSFDAGAKSVQIVFDFKAPGGALYIVDDGKGMSQADIMGKWLFLAYSAKKEGTEDGASTKEHIYSGNKGVGRFSCDRLGQILEIQSKVKSSNKIHTLYVDWEKFEKNATKEFSLIPMELDETTMFCSVDGLDLSNKYSGVLLKISSLRAHSSWTRKKIIELKRALAKLIDPFNGEILSRRINIICKEQEDEDAKEIERAGKKRDVPFLINGPVENHIFEVLETKTTKLNFHIDEYGKLITELVDRGMCIYKTEESVKKDYPLLLPSNFNCTIAYLNTSAKATFARRMGVHSVDYGSLFLVRNGFRVYPVGEENDDFWGIASRKQQGYKRYLGTREILGCVHISGSENDFKESSSRDKGLIETPASMELQNCVMRCLRKLEAYVTTVSWTDGLDKDEDSPSRLKLDENRAKIIQLVEKMSLSPKITVTYYNPDLVSILENKSQNFEKTLQSLRIIAEKKNDIELLKQLDLADKKAQKVQKALVEAQRIAQAEQDARRNAETVAATAQLHVAKVKKEYEEEQKRNLFLLSSGARDKDLLECFMHQIIIYASNAKLQLENALIDYNNAPKQDPFVTELLTDQLESMESIISTSRFATSANFRMDSEQINEDLCSFIEQYIDKIACVYNTKMDLKCENPNHARFILKFNPIEIGMIIDNLISNSNKARASNFTVKMNVANNVLFLEFLDNGRGIHDISDQNRIFEKGFTRTSGSGIGLYFCKKILNRIDSDIYLSHQQPNKGTSFTVKVKKK